ncbi:MAG TPA: biotin carboxylase N-terminal domain-containing protein [Candidatus Binataceae bacterium]|nr:biotin carboxylase N-terminal domain-containing protein [Candidatus Binataceae bacterium]
MKARKIKRILIANRGEIALRIIRSARVMGIETVAVYSAADAAAAHVAAADDARPIGAAEPAASYLNIAAILEAAHAASADAIHPGYGFLSERPEFARAVEQSGIIFVGPPAEVMAALGDKVAARRIAINAGVPVVPGSDAGDLEAARKFAASSGYPILVKAAAGGGGRGMRVVGEAAGLAPALEAAAREALAAFGDGRIFLEKYIARPRHVEVQLLGDHHGTVVALGDRDCSIQRRHQKLIEEAPAPGLKPVLRERMAAAALTLARAAGYRGAGTAEFLVDGDNFYFLEVNARLQVEHPVTELIFGCDLVAEQLRIAMGERVAEPPAARGCAIECRINAEDPAQDFRPATGRVIKLALPAGPGVRVDTHLEAGTEIAPYYDSLIAKLICHGGGREQARARTAAALGEFMLLGVRNTAAFVREIIASEPFARADLSTRFIADHFPHWSPADRDLHEALIAAALAANGMLGGAAATGGGGNRSSATADGAAARSPWTTLGEFELWGRR